MSFKNLNIGLITNYCGSQLSQLKTQIYTSGKIRRHTDSALFSSGNHLGMLLGIQTRGANHHLLIVSGTECSIGNSRSGNRKVD